MKKIYLVRHGENRANITKELSYKLVDYPLNKKGRVQADLTGEYFIGKGVKRIFSSPLKRAYETAKIIGKKIDVIPEVCEELRELNVGELELDGASDEMWRICNSVIMGWREGRKEVSFPGGENYFILINRMKKILNRVVSEEYAKVIIVAHGGLFRETIEDIVKISDKSLLDRVNNNCSITTLTHESGLFNLVEWANIKHLKGEAAEFVNPYKNI